MVEFFEVLRHLVCNTLTILFSANCKSIQSWKQKLIIWNSFSAEISKLLELLLHTFIFAFIFLFC